MKRVVVFAGALVAACTSSAPAPERDGHASHDAVALIRSHDLLRSSLDRAIGGGGVLRTVLPSDPTLRWTVGHPSGAALEIEPLTIHASKVTREADRVTAELPSQTAVFYHERDRAEELRVLWSSAAPRVFHYRLHARAATLRAREGNVELVDQAGRGSIALEKMFVVDARGVRHDVSAELAHDGEDTLLTARIPDSAFEYPLILDPAWSMGPNMLTAREDFTLTPIGSARYLAAGGRSRPTTASLTTAEIYDSGTNSWSAAATMLRGRAFHTAVALADGRVLISGGGSTNTADLYTPSTNSWSVAGAVTSAGWINGHRMTLLGDGRVLLTGGNTFITSSSSLSAALVYNPATNSWSAVASMSARRTGHTSTLLTDGRVLVTGGTDLTISGHSSAEIFNPASGSWTTVASMSAERSGHAAVRLASGNVLVAAGPGVTAEMYNPSTNTWTAVGDIIGARSNLRMLLQPSGRAVALGGYGVVATTPIVSVFDPGMSTFTSGGSMSVSRNSPEAALLPSGAVLVAGGTVSNTAVATVEIYSPMANGATCTSPGECASGLCVDGYCCNSSCTSSCMACDLAGSLGTCTAVGSSAPRGSRTCAPYVSCAGSTCASSCTSSTECATTHYCSGGKCVPRLGLGAACASARDCASNSCVDGVCCNTACTGQCEACNTAGSVGTCKAVVGAPIGGRAPCVGVGGGTVCGIACNGVDRTACRYASTSVSCSANACVGGTETHANACDGAGKCGDVPKPCGAYACGTVVCKTVCTSTADCAAGHYCKGGACTPAEGLGTACTSPSACSTGHCVDGVCCAVASCDTGSSCALTGKGTCSKTLGTACAAATECASGVCADGVCCSSPCDGQCEACDVAGAAGTCSPVQGTPHGARAACDGGGSNPCAARECDGLPEHRTICSGYKSGAKTICRTASCDESTFSPATSCDGAGACRDTKPVSCAPYACGTSGCLTACAADSECAKDFRCEGSTCVARGVRCGKDGVTSISRDDVPTKCTPYRCGTAGTCLEKCATTEDCALGGVCDLASSKCVASEAGSGEEGGCTYGRRSNHVGAVALLLALATISRRRSATR